MDVTGIIGFVNLFDDISMLGSNCGDGLLQQCNILHPVPLVCLALFLSEFNENVVVFVVRF